MRDPSGAVGWAKRSVPTRSRCPAWARRKCAFAHPATVTLPSLQHDLAARFSRFDQGMRALEVGGVDGAKDLVERGAQHALVEEVGDVVEQIVLADRRASGTTIA